MVEIPFFLPVDQRANREQLIGTFLTTMGSLNPGVNYQRAEKVFQRFVNTYSESHGHYHNLNHIQHLLRLTGYFRHLLNEPTVVEASIWGHDLVQRKLGNDEEKSAGFALAAFDDLGVPADKRAKIGSYIISTKDHKNPTGDLDLSYFLDMDMAILGSPWERYSKYARDIRREYEDTDPDKFKLGRIEFLTETMKEPIFKTPAFAPLEILARTNISREIAMLEVIPTT
jgi:predicted metal-dependent HD superfamily phosphohydrolase